MKFAIAETSYFESVGFNTEHWRKSLDGSKALCHSEFALLLCNKEDIQVYDIQDAEFKEILAGEEWTEQLEEPVE